MYSFYIDESGDHNLSSFITNGQLFLLCGCFIANSEIGLLEQKMENIKLKYFGTRDVILHYRDFRKRNGYYSIFMDRSKNDSFLFDISEMIKDIKFGTVCSVIDKEAHIKQYGKLADDPYNISLSFIVERFIFAVENTVRGIKIFAENRGGREDNKLIENWVKLYNRGTGYISTDEVKAKIGGLSLHSKKENIPGLQLADFIASSTLRKFIKPQENEEIFEAAKTKIVKFNEGCLGKGIKVFPQGSLYKKTINPII